MNFKRCSSMLIQAALPIALLLAAAATAQSGPIYKWVDPQGRYHYSDRPQPGWTRVDVRPGTGNVAAPEDAASAAQRTAQLRAEECQRRREQLESYRKASRVVERNSLGEEKEYSEAERIKLIALTEAQVAELCGPPPPDSVPATPSTDEEGLPAEEAPAEEPPEIYEESEPAMQETEPQ